MTFNPQKEYQHYGELMESLDSEERNVFAIILPEGIDNSDVDFNEFARRLEHDIVQVLQAKGMLKQKVRYLVIAKWIEKFYNLKRLLQTDDSSMSSSELNRMLTLSQIIADSQQSVEITYAVGATLMDIFQFKTYRDTKEIVRYDEAEGIWVDDGEAVIEKTIKRNGLKLSKHQIMEIIYHIQTSTYEERANFVGVLDGVRLHLENGWLNMDTLDLEPHSAGKLSIAKVPTRFDKMVGPVEFVKVLNEALDPESRQRLLKVIGNLLVADCRYEKATLFVGEGHNRKGTILFALEAMLGRENCCHVSLQEISDDRFAPADFYAKMANLVADLNALKISYTGRFKELVSGDSIRVQRKRQHAFDMNNQAKMLFSTNDIPPSDDQTHAFYRRWEIILFYRSFDRDPTLQRRLSTEAEKSGLLNLMLWGRKKLLEEGFDDIPIEKVRLLYNRHASLIRDFLEQECIIDMQNEEFVILTETVQNAFKNFAETKGKNRKTLNIRQLGQELNKLGIEHKQMGPRKQRDYYYIGMMLKSELAKKQQRLL